MSADIGPILDTTDLLIGKGYTCARCGNPCRGHGSVTAGGVRKEYCHPSNYNYPDCYSLALREVPRSNPVLAAAEIGPVSRLPAPDPALEICIDCNARVGQGEPCACMPCPDCDGFLEPLAYSGVRCPKCGYEFCY